MPAFSATDAEAMLGIAASAPIPNMRDAEIRAALFMRFRVFVEAAFNPPPAVAETPAKGKKARGADGEKPPADPLA